MNSTQGPDHTRRRLLISAAAVAASPASLVPTPRDWVNGTPLGYPDPDIVALDPRFRRYIVFNTPLQRLHTGTLWAEGPAWNGTGRYLVWSDIPSDQQLRWLDDDGHVSSLRRPSGNSNGNTFDARGRQLAAEHGNRRIVRYEPTGELTVVADSYQGKRLNSPNDVVVHPDGSRSAADGIRCDADGNLWAGARPGVVVLSPDGATIGFIRLPEICANVCFGGVKRNRLFMAASQSLYAVYVGVRGAHWC